MRHIGKVFDKVARKALARHGGPVMAELARVWPALCPEIADFARPEALKRSGRQPATLKLRVEPGRALEVQMMQPVVMERINAHFGQPVVARISLVQAPLVAGGTVGAGAEDDAEGVEPDAALLRELTARLDNVQDAELRAVLERMAEGIARRMARARGRGLSRT